MVGGASQSPPPPAATGCVAEGGCWVAVGVVVVTSMGSLKVGELLFRSCEINTCA